MQRASVSSSLSISSPCPLARAVALGAAVVVLGWSAHALADPLPGEVLKFDNEPMLATPILGTIYSGHDEPSNAIPSTNPPGYLGNFMADDFADKVSSPVVHVTWWGSYLGTSQAHVPSFLISFESDVPAVTGGPTSHPGTPLLTQVVTAGALTPGSGHFTEALVGASSDGPIYKYNAELLAPFPEIANTVYWLKIVALEDFSGEFTWGWHNRDYTVHDTLASTPPLVSPGEFVSVGPGGVPVWHFQDDAVSGFMTLSPVAPPITAPIVLPPVDLVESGFAPHTYVDTVDGPTGISSFSKDLAFQLYTVPEPGLLVLVGVAVTLLVARRPEKV